MHIYLNGCLINSLIIFMSYYLCYKQKIGLENLKTDIVKVTTSVTMFILTSWLTTVFLITYFVLLTFKVKGDK